MWMNAPRILRSPFLPRANRSAVAVLMTMPMDATTMTVPPATGCGDPSLLIASKAMAPIATSRSEEHTSELQSLMRISYAVFCLKKKKEYHLVSKTYTGTVTTYDEEAAEDNHSDVAYGHL